MVTMAFLNFIYGIVHSILTLVFGQLIPVLDDLTLWITNVSIPQTVFDIFSLTFYFIPLATVAWLATGTILIISVKLVFALFKAMNPISMIIGT